jgi:hypothetical protein
MIGIYNILIDDRLYKKVEPKIKRKELLVFGFLSAMIIVLSLIGTTATFVYTSVIFKNLIVASIASIFMLLVVFNLVRLLIITSISAYHTKLGIFQLDHSLIFDNIKMSEDEEKDQLKILEVVNRKKESLRNISKTKGSHNKNLEQRITFIIKLIILTFLALIFATGIELLIFSNQLNDAFEAIKLLYADQPESWMLSQALNPEGGNFYILNTNSILLAIDVLNFGLGWMKYLLDAAFIVLFITPLLISFKSKKIFDSNYVRELALHEVSVSYYSYLIKERACENISESILSYNLKNMLPEPEK